MNLYVRDIKVDIDNISADFGEKIKEAFENQFSEKDNISKLKFIDLCIKDMHKAYSDVTLVKDFVKSKIESEINKTGVLDLSCLWTMDFLEQCYNLGKSNYKLYASYTEDTADNYKILQLIYRIIKVIIKYDTPESEWLYNEKGEMVCGNCGEQNFELVKYNYCPECGAKMKEDSEDEDNNSINAEPV